MLGLIYKTLKVITFVEHLFKKPEKRLNMVSRAIEEIFLKTQIKILEMEIIMSEMKNTVGRTNSRLDIGPNVLKITLIM